MAQSATDRRAMLQEARDKTSVLISRLTEQLQNLGQCTGRIDAAVQEAGRVALERALAGANRVLREVEQAIDQEPR